MFVPIGNDFKVPNEIGDTIEMSIFAFFTVIGIIYLIWLLAYRGRVCKQHPNLPVWVQELMDCEYLIIDGFAAFIAVFILSIFFSIMADMFYHFLAWAHVVELQPTPLSLLSFPCLCKMVVPKMIEINPPK